MDGIGTFFYCPVQKYILLPSNNCINEAFGKLIPKCPVGSGIANVAYSGKEFFRIETGHRFKVLDKIGLIVVLIIKGYLRQFGLYLPFLIVFQGAPEPNHGFELFDGKTQMLFKDSQKGFLLMPKSSAKYWALGL